MPDPIDPDLAASIKIATAQLEQLFAFLDGLNLQPHEHDQVSGKVVEHLNQRDHRLGPAIEDKWHEHPGWGHKPDKPGHGPTV